MSTPRREFIKQLSLGAAGFGLVPMIPQTLLAEIKKVTGLPRGIAEQEGLSSESILAFIKSVEQKKLGLHSLMIVRHGKVITEGWWDPYKPDIKHMLFSLSKSFTSTAIGLAVAERRLTVEDKVISFFPKHQPQNISPNLAAIRVKDLLTMNTGHDKDTMGTMRAGTESWIRTFLSLPVEHKPGSFFLYNSGATYLLAAILQKLTGKSLLDYLTPRLLEPLDIKNADWEISPEGIHTGAYGLRVTTEDIAKFGQLYLQKGNWNGKRILSEKWVEEATSFQVPNASLTGKDENSDWQQGYGYQFWRCRHDLYRGDGAVGQYCIVMPAYDAVVAITSETSNMQAIMNETWTHLLAGMKPSSLPQNQQVQSALKQKLSTLTLLPSTIITTSSIMPGITGKPFKLQENEMNASELSLKFAGNNCVFSLKENNKVHTISCGLDHWEKGETVIPGAPPNLVNGNNKLTVNSKVAAAGLWKDENTFEMILQYFETPHSDAVTCYFENNSLRLEFKNSLMGKVGSFKETRPVLKGTWSI
ncbi:MAG: serine hydrolase [Chitinophagaceae bacterium]|nr:serine hydrolase [Chitinophagaceae bacterium]